MQEERSERYTTRGKQRCAGQDVYVTTREFLTKKWRVEDMQEGLSLPVESPQFGGDIVFCLEMRV
jgi:hypothetical protein